MSMPAIDLNSSPASRDGVPPPAEPKVSVPGRARASAMSSPTLRAGTSAWTTRTIGVTTASEIGERSLTGS